MEYLSAAMPLNPTWTDIAIRLLLTVAAGAVIGLNRQAGGHSAGLRTTILVGLAASVAMCQSNLLLSSTGKTFQSFTQMDVLRLPLGVLTGVGFIGGGAILKRGDIAVGVTTAATMWIMTAIGLCFGGGQILVGIAATVLAIFVLLPLRTVDTWVPHEQKGHVMIVVPDGAEQPDLQGLLGKDAKVWFRGKQRAADNAMEYNYALRWKNTFAGHQAERVLALIEQHFRITQFHVADETE